jgi:3D-(3,5/4)-trihydroxycyclohexane-1,2-dione acylhydrolase (decyclizing)
MSTVRLTTAQALVRFLANQWVERDGEERRFFAGCFGIFGHGNVAGIGQALQQNLEDAGPTLRYLPARNEQAMVHAAAAYAKMKDRLETFACTTSIGPGATNMVTAAAGATINRVPVLLLPGDVFARRNVDPVLQQLESPEARDVSVNDCLRPVSRYFDRVWRPDQLPSALMSAMRVLTSPADTGAVTLALPQDVQAEAWDFPEALFDKRVWRIARPAPEPELVERAAEWIRSAERPLLIAGGGVHYSDATGALRDLAEATGLPVSETQAGKGALDWRHPQSVGAMGATGSLAANRIARDADLIIGVGTRYSDFTTSSQTAFQSPAVRFLNLNVAEMDAHKQAALPLLGDARRGLDALRAALDGWSVTADHAGAISSLREEWNSEVDRVFAPGDGALPLAQAEVLGALHEVKRPTDVVVCAAGSLPGDLHKLFRCEDPKSYHLEYGYSCMGYEVAGGLGVKLAAPDREVITMVGDGSWLMMATELVTAVQEQIPLRVLLLDNHGYGSIGGLSEALGSEGFGTEYRARDGERLTGAHLPVDYLANAASFGCKAVRAKTREDVKRALVEARGEAGPVVIVVETARQARVPGYDSWWDVPVAEVSTMSSVQAARAKWQEGFDQERHHLGGGS